MMLRQRFKPTGFWLSIFLSAQLIGCPAFALSGFEVVSGDVTFQQSGDVFNVTSNSAQAIVQWQSFNVDSGQTVNFLLPSNTSSIFNRILSGGSSNILGNINSNGTVLLSNPAGINIGSTANINAGGFIASTLNLSNTNYLNNNWVFSRADGVSPAGILNEGNITTAPGGFVVLAGGAVMNTGNILAPEGTVHLAVGDEIRIALNQNTVVDVTINQSLMEKVDEYQAAIANFGAIDARTVMLQADLLEAFYATTINNEGVLRATTTSALGDNSIRVYAFSEDQQATLRNGGVVEVSGTELAFDGGTVEMLGDVVHNTGDVLATGANGGNIHLLGREVAVYGDSTLNASGQNGGGEILIGGDYQGKNPEVRNAEKTWVTSNVAIKADALESGNGGKVIVWSDDSTQYYGSISAKGGEVSGDGGFVEVSGKHSLNFMGNVDVTAQAGQTGTLLLDPTDITIVDGAGADDAQLADDQILQADAPAVMQIGETALEGLANTANVVLQASNDIIIQDLSDNVLDMAQTTGSVTFTADSDSNGVGNFTMLDTNDMIRTQGGDLTISGVSVSTGSFDLGTGNLDIQTVAAGGAVTIGSILGATDATIVTIGDNAPVTVNGAQTVLDDYFVQSNGLTSPITISGTITAGDQVSVDAFRGNGGFNITGDIIAGGDIYLADENPTSASVVNGNIYTPGSLDFNIGGGNDLTLTGGEIVVGSVGLNAWAGGNITIDNNITATAGDIVLDLSVGVGDAAVVNGNLSATGDVQVSDFRFGSVTTNGTISGDTVTYWGGNANGNYTINGAVSSNNVVFRSSANNNVFNVNTTVAATNDITVNAAGVPNTILNANGLLSSGNNITFNTDSTVISGNYSANNNITVNSNGLTQSGTTSLVADADASGAGTLAINDALNTLNNNTTLQGAQVTWANPITGGTGNIVVSSSQDLTLAQEITANNIYLSSGGSIIDGNGVANNLTATGSVTVSATGGAGTLADPLELNTPVLNVYPSVETPVFSGTAAQVNFLGSGRNSGNTADGYYEALLSMVRYPNGDFLGQVILNNEPLTFFSQSTQQATTDFLQKPYVALNPLQEFAKSEGLNYAPSTSTDLAPPVPLTPQNLVRQPEAPVNRQEIRQAKRLIQKNGRLYLSSGI